MSGLLKAPATVVPPRPAVAVQDAKGGVLAFLYGTLPGRMLLKPLTRPAFSRLAGVVLNSRLSSLAVKPFARRHGIRLSDYEPVSYRSYNEFFTRRIRPQLRPIDRDPAHLISPCDCKLSAYPIGEDSRFEIKHSSYTVPELLGGDPIAQEYRGGICLICRLTVDDYHRYCYLDNGWKEGNHFLPGELHTVQPIALDHVNIYKRNCREYTVLHTAHFGDVVQIEVGALMVGKIRNHHGPASFGRGQEKGFFEFGGSTIVLLLKKDAAAIDADILKNTRLHLETIVRMGQKIGTQL